MNPTPRVLNASSLFFAGPPSKLRLQVLEYLAPLTQEEMVEIGIVDSSGIAYPGQVARVLTVENSPTNLRIIARALSDSGFATPGRSGAAKRAWTNFTETERTAQNHRLQRDLKNSRGKLSKTTKQGISDAARKRATNRWKNMSLEERQTFIQWRKDCQKSARTSRLLDTQSYFVEEYLDTLKADLIKQEDKPEDIGFSDFVLNPTVVIGELGRKLQSAAKEAGITEHDLALYIYVQAKRRGFQVERPNPFAIEISRP